MLLLLDLPGFFELGALNENFDEKQKRYLSFFGIVFRSIETWGDMIIQPTLLMPHNYTLNI